MSKKTPDQRAIADAYYPELSRIGKAIASPNRLEILDLLRQGPRCVDDIAAHLGLTAANVSQHLKQLREARLVESEKDAQRVFYRVANDNVCRFVCALQTVADQQLAEVAELRRTVLDIPDDLSVKEIEELARSGKATVVDVRPPVEFDAGHMSGAINIPLPEVAARIDELPRDQDLVVYCRGVYCVLALEAVRVLREHGLRAHRLPLGIVDMRSRRWRVERTRQPRGARQSRSPSSSRKKSR